MTHSDWMEVLKFVNTIWPVLVILGSILSGLVGAKVKAYLLRNKMLSKPTQAILDALERSGITTETISGILAQVNAYSTLSDAEKQNKAQELLQSMGKWNGVIISDGVANDIITTIWMKMKAPTPTLPTKGN